MGYWDNGSDAFSWQQKLPATRAPPSVAMRYARITSNLHSAELFYSSLCTGEKGMANQRNAKLSKLCHILLQELEGVPLSKTTEGKAMHIDACNEYIRHKMRLQLPDLTIKNYLRTISTRIGVSIYTPMDTMFSRTTNSSTLRAFEKSCAD
jgi:hypothetical protein